MEIGRLLKRRFIRLGVSGRREFRGCSDDEIASVAKAQKVVLPEVYVSFLRMMGHSSGRFMLGTDVHYPRLLELKDGAVELLSTTKAGLALPDDACVFYMHQGYCFMYFPTGKGEPDPPVFGYMEGEAAFKPMNDHLSQFLDKAALEDAFTPLHRCYDKVCRYLWNEPYR